MEYLYTLAFLKRNDEILMINRVKHPWMGMWNGVGGKRQHDESALDCILREVFEETNIKVNHSNVFDRGIVTWNDQFKAFSNGLHLFLIELPNDFVYQTPKVTDEGILDWKKFDWINQKDNIGVSYNIPYFIDNVVHHNDRYHYDCLFESYRLIEVKAKKI